jgi:hypothetical protein
MAITTDSNSTASLDSGIDSMIAEKMGAKLHQKSDSLCLEFTVLASSLVHRIHKGCRYAAINVHVRDFTFFSQSSFISSLHMTDHTSTIPKTEALS